MAAVFLGMGVLGYLYFLTGATCRSAAADVLWRRSWLMDAIETGTNESLASRPTLAQPLIGEDIVAYLTRIEGRVTRERCAQWLGAANPYKEGDVFAGVAAVNAAHRGIARALVAATRLRTLDAMPLFDDELTVLLAGSVDGAARAATAEWTLDELASFLIRETGDRIDMIARGLSSIAIGSVVKLLSDAQLTAVSAKLFRALPGSMIGASGYLGARLQPNSPTDHPDDIRWQVFCGWAFGVGDVLLGTNPVSSDPRSIAIVEHTLRDVLQTFQLDAALPHCVLSHIDVQAAVEQAHPGSTALWFQSIAGSDAANRTFDVTVSKMLGHAAARVGRYGFYFETGQGADCTNGHANGVDMVLHESRKYGFARALTARVADAQRGAGTAVAPWVIVNDVAGFIGPEVFRTRAQLVRCCLEDLVMGKLHGLTIGLDVCATLHMDISLDDLDWCLDQVLPACPAYLMALPTKVDPMLGYLTTGFQDHVRLRENSGSRVNPPMQAFFESIGVLDADGAPGPSFGDPLQLFVAYQRRRGDVRDAREIRAVGAVQLAAVRARGVFIAEGHGERAADLSPALDETIRAIYDDAKLAFWATLPPTFVQSIPDVVVLESCSASREQYVLHPETGERLSARSVDRVCLLRDAHANAYDLQLVISDGLNALSIVEPGQLRPFLDAVRQIASDAGWRVAPEHLVINAGRVRAGYRVAETLFDGRSDRCALVHVIGERPGTGHNTFSAYVSVADGATWSTRNAVDHDITRVVSGVAHTALPPLDGARHVGTLLQRVG